MCVENSRSSKSQNNQIVLIGVCTDIEPGWLINPTAGGFYLPLFNPSFDIYLLYECCGKTVHLSCSLNINSYSSMICTNVPFFLSVYVACTVINELRHEKTGLRGFRPGPTQTGLYSYTGWLRI